MIEVRLLGRINTAGILCTVHIQVGQYLSVLHNTIIII